MGRSWLIGLLSVAAFLAAAKTHGRQIRIERELHGKWSVTFGAKNDPIVEAIWRRDRIIYWTVAAVCAAAGLAYAIARSRFGWRLILWLLVWPMTAAFLSAGLLSLARLVWRLNAGTSVSSSAPPGWLSAAGWSSAGWWSLAAALAAGLAVAVFRS